MDMSKDLRSEPHAAPRVHLINRPPRRPPSVAALGLQSGGRWRQLIESLASSGCGSLTLVLGGRLSFCCWQRRSQPQTEQDDEVTDVEGSRAAVS